MKYNDFLGDAQAKRKKYKLNNYWTLLNVFNCSVKNTRASNFRVINTSPTPPVETSDVFSPQKPNHMYQYTEFDIAALGAFQVISKHQSF